MNPRNADTLIPLFQPKHVAVVGASRTPGKHGHTVVKNLTRGFTGGIWPVSPAGEEIEGRTCYRAIADLPAAPDCVFLAIPATAVVEAVEACAKIGARAIVIGANGFAESGTADGRARQAAITKIAHDHGIRLLGPNTNGFINNDDRVAVGYNTSHGEPHKITGLSIASHSGAILNSVARRLAHAGSGFSKWVSIGNEADIDLLDVFEYFIADPATQVIGLIIEGIRDGARFRDLAAQAHGAGKPVVALKLGRSAAGAGAALAHSSRLAGSARAYEALFRASGVASVRTLEAFTGGCSLLRHKGRTAAGDDDGIICVATSGGGGGMVVDMAAEFGLPLAGTADGDFGSAVNGGLAALGGIGALRNPVDLSLLGNTWTPLVDVFRVMGACGKTGPTVCFAHVAARPQQDERLVAGLLARQQAVEAPVLVFAPGGLLPHIEALYAENGIPVFHDIVTAMESLQCWYVACRAQPAPLAPAGSPVGGALALLRASADKASEGVLGEFDSAAILARAGVPMVASWPVISGEEAKFAASQLGYPVVLKAMLPGVAHKSRLGLVLPRLADGEAVERAFHSLQARAAALGHGVDELTCLVQPMLPADYELILGVSREGDLGHFLVAGLGGIYSEILDEVLLFPLGLTKERLASELAASRLGRIAAQRQGHGEDSAPAHGHGHDHHHDHGHGHGESCAVAVPVLDQIVEILARLQDLVSESGNTIDSIDLNPMLVREGACIAVDALVVLRSV